MGGGCHSAEVKPSSSSSSSSLCDADVVGMVEVLKKMQDLGLSPDADMLYTFIVPLFPNRNAARKALMVRTPSPVSLLVMMMMMMF